MLPTVIFIAHHKAAIYFFCGSLTRLNILWPSKMPHPHAANYIISFTPKKTKIKNKNMCIFGILTKELLSIFTYDTRLLYKLLILSSQISFHIFSRPSFIDELYMVLSRYPFN